MRGEELENWISLAKLLEWSKLLAWWVGVGGKEDSNKGSESVFNIPDISDLLKIIVQCLPSALFLLLNERLPRV